jgi:GMP reductase|tara:strand:- start:3835 stop:4908 length:1074 start_codon:yes stop_codon:yes gene_type:complete
MAIIADGIKLDFDDVLIKPKRSTLTSRSGVSIEKSYSYLHAPVKEAVVPIVAANMDTVGTMAMAEKLGPKGMQTCLHKYYNVAELVDFFTEAPRLDTFFTIGIKQEDVDKLLTVDDMLPENPIHKICIDVANGYQKVFVDHVKRCREFFPDAVIMAGNVCTPEMVSELLISGGADIIKIGIGPGSVCSTRRITGCGYPQLSAIIECADAAHGIGGLICADGGCKEPGDVVKAFAAGADFVMLGGMLAGTEECEGEWEYEGWTHAPCGMRIERGVSSTPNKKKSLKFYGMSSEAAMDKHNGGVGSYRASEGIIKSVPYKGPVENVLQEVAGGIRSACAYVGAPTLKDLPKCATFVLRR